MAVKGMNFGAEVEAWCLKVPAVIEAIFKASVQELVSQLNDLVPRDTGFLQSSLLASTSEMPLLNRAPGAIIPAGQIELVINAAELGETIYLGYTANYGAYVHYGTSKMPGRPWVDMVAQRWQSIVDQKTAELKAKLGL